MDRNQYLLSGIIILVVLVVAVIAFAFSGNSTFNSGTVSFEYPKAWSQNSMVGNFNSSSIIFRSHFYNKLSRCKWAESTSIYYNSDATKS